MITENGESLSSQIVQPEFRFDGLSVFLVMLFWNLNVIKRHRFCYKEQNEGFLRENCVCNRFHISHFHVFLISCYS